MVLRTGTASASPLLHFSSRASTLPLTPSTDDRQFTYAAAAAAIFSLFFSEITPTPPSPPAAVNSRRNN